MSYQSSAVLTRSDVTSSRGSEPGSQSSATEWTTVYKKLPKTQPLSVRFLIYAAGASRGAILMKRKKIQSNFENEFCQVGRTKPQNWARYASSQESELFCASRKTKRGRQDTYHHSNSRQPQNIPPYDMSAPVPVFNTTDFGPFALAGQIPPVGMTGLNDASRQPSAAPVMPSVDEHGRIQPIDSAMGAPQ